MGYEDPTAVANQLFDATLFDIAGPIHVNYSSSSITGAPLVSYKDAELDLNFQGDDITRVETSLGELVTVTLQTGPDAVTRTFTLIVPTIRVPHGRTGRIRYARNRDHRPLEFVRGSARSGRSSADLSGPSTPRERPTSRLLAQPTYATRTAHHC